MKLKILFFLAIIFPSLAMAQQKTPVDFREIERSVNDPKSHYYYPELLRRYRAADTSFTLDDKRHLYYGSSFQDNYDAYGSSSYEDSIRTVLRKKTLLHDDYLKVIRLADAALLEFPFALRALNYKAVSCRKINEQMLYRQCRAQMDVIFDAIISSGDGKTLETAMAVVNVADEYATLSALGLQFAGSQQLVEDHYDYLTVQKNEYGLEGLYFNAERCFAAMDRLFGDDEKKKPEK